MTITLDRVHVPPEVERHGDLLEDITRREFVIGGAALSALVAAGCGTGNDTGSGADAAGTHQLIDATGLVDLPLRYARPVPTHALWATNMLSLGIAPAALPAHSRRQIETVAEYLPQDIDIDGLPEIGLTYDINIEALAAASPDLIIASGAEADAREGEYRGIAPTYFVEHGSNGSWRERFERVAAALGATDRVADIVERYDAKVAALPEELRSQTIAFVRSSTVDDIRIDTLPTSFPGSVAMDAGLDVLDLSDALDFDSDASWITVSPERLDVLAGADIIILGDDSFYDAGLTPTDAVLADTPLWATLPAVQAGAVVQLPGPVYNGGTYESATALLDALVEALRANP